MKAPDARRSWAHSIPVIVLFLVLAVALGRWTWLATRAMAFPYPLDYGEGPLLDQVARLVLHTPLYRADLSSPPYTVANYPPLYPAVLTPFYLAFGPAYWYGRLTSWVSILAAAALTGAVVHRFTRDTGAALVSAALLLTIPYAAYWSVLFRIDCLALATSLAGLLLLLRSGGRVRGVVAAAFFMVAAVFVRQSYGLAAPAAAVAWLVASGHRRGLAYFLGVAAGLGGVLFLVLEVATHGGFSHNIVVANVNEYRPARVAEHFRDLATLAPVLLVFGAASLGPRVQEARAERVFLGTYLGAAVVSALTIGKVGSNVNYFLELSVALCLATGWGLARMKPGWKGAAAVGLLAVQVVIFIPRTEAYFGRSEARIAHKDALDGLADLIHEADGPVLADSDLGFLPLDHRPIYFQPFELTQLARSGRWDPAPLAREVLTGRFPLILLHNPEEKEVLLERWPRMVLEALRTAYAPSGRVGNTFLFRPSSGKRSKDATRPGGSPSSSDTPGVIEPDRRPAGSPGHEAASTRPGSP